MTRKTRGLAALCMLATLAIPIIASAGWHTDELGWHISRIGGATGTAIVQVDTAFTVVNGVSVFDTTAVFSLDRADVPPRGNPVVSLGALAGSNTATNDTTVVAYLTLQPDSGTVAPAVGSGTITVMVEGKIGGYGPVAVNSSGWSRIDSTVTTLGSTSLDQSVTIPIRTIGKYSTPLGFSSLRVRTIGGTATLGACRSFLRWWENDSSNPKRP